MENSKIINFDYMKDIWNRISDMLDIDFKNMSVIITDCPHNPIPQRRELYKIFLNEFECNEVLIASTSALTLYGVGLTNGLVLDCGEGTTHTLPVIEGFSAVHGVSRSNIAGKSVTDYLQYLLRLKGHDFNSSSEYEIVRDIKERYSTLEMEQYKLDQFKLLENTPNDPVYVLPDGSQFEIRAERFLCSEVLFNPQLINSEQPSVLDCVVKSINKMDIQSRKRLMENVIITGGTSQMNNFTQRLSLELKNLKDKNTSHNWKFYNTRDYKSSAWNGAKIIAELNT